MRPGGEQGRGRRGVAMRERKRAVVCGHGRSLVQGSMSLRRTPPVAIDSGGGRRADVPSCIANESPSSARGTLRWRDTAGRLIANGCASSVTDASPCARRANGRVGSAAANVRLSESGGQRASHLPKSVNRPAAVSIRTRPGRTATYNRAHRRGPRVRPDRPHGRFPRCHRDRRRTGAARSGDRLAGSGALPRSPRAARAIVAARRPPGRAAAAGSSPARHSPASVMRELARSLTQAVPRTACVCRVADTTLAILLANAHDAAAVAAVVEQAVLPALDDRRIRSGSRRIRPGHRHRAVPGRRWRPRRLMQAAEAARRRAAATARALRVRRGREQRARVGATRL